MHSKLSMQRYTQLELSVGAFVIIGALALAYLSLSLGGLDFTRADRYSVFARFSSVGSLKVGDPVRLAGVSVGEVAGVKVVDFAAQVDLTLQNEIKLPEDTIASIQSASLLGEMYVSLSPGASDHDLAPGARIMRTEPAVSLTELIAKYAFGSPISEAEGGSGSGSPGQAGSAPEKKSPFSDPLE